MPQENGEVVRALIAAFNRRDGGMFDSYLASDAEIVPVRAAVEGTVYRGRKAGTHYCDAVDGSWVDLMWELEETREGDQWVLALGRIRGSGRSSGAGVDVQGAWLVRFRDGLVTHFRTYPDRPDALKAAGLEE